MRLEVRLGIFYPVSAREDWQSAGCCSASEGRGSDVNSCDLRHIRGRIYNGPLASQQGRLAQRLERLVHTEEARGSNPLSPTINEGQPRWRNGRRATFRA